MKLLKEELKKMIVEHPRAVTFGIGLAIAAAIVVGIGAVEAPQQAFAGGGCRGCWS